MRRIVREALKYGMMTEVVMVRLAEGKELDSKRAPGGEVQSVRLYLGKWPNSGSTVFAFGILVLFRR